ncbi:MAG TPA: molybdenum ABC transporter ATP-binding protein [Burkholderiales bacterium]|nr:molybdenum ABC transporter ATP-binding protein [Burkholderiales bacterium]
MSVEIDVERRLGNFQLKAAFTSNGSVTALFGRSGSGKSTLVNIIAGLLEPDRGRAAVEGQVLFDHVHRINVPPRKRRVGCVFQDGRLLPHLTVKQNLLYGHYFTPQAERYVEFDQVIELLGLETLLQRRPGKLSGGEKQRVAIGRALLASPRIFLMDEPLANLDSARKSEILYYLERLRDEMRVPILYVTHAIEEVARLADTMAVLANGRVIACGEVEEVMARLELYPFTGRYESGAIIDATVIAHDANFELTRLRFAGGELIAPNVQALIGEPVRVRIRARDVSIALLPPGDMSILNVLRGRVEEIREEEGALADLRIDVSGTSLLARITKHSRERLKLQVGQEVYALVKAVSLDRHSLGLV